MTEGNSTLRRPLESVRSRIAEQSGSRRGLLLMAPLIVFELLVFVIPFFSLLRISVAGLDSGTAYEEGTWSLEAYREVLTSDILLHVISYSFQIGVIVTVLSVVIGFFYAYAIWQSTGLVKTLLLFSVVLPLLTTLVIRTYAFYPLLSPTGTIPLGLVPGMGGVIIGQLYIVLPYAVLAIYSVMATMDWDVVEAARDLGASRPRSVLEVVVPQAMPGIIVATVISFAWSVGSYAAPDLLSNGITFAIRVEGLLLSDIRYPEAAAMSVIMLVLMTGSVGIIFAVLNRFGGDFELA